MDEKSIMVNLGDEKGKEIGEVIGNKTCNKILNYLSDNEGTVSDISGKLKIPINTIDYNVKKLVKAGLIEKNSHFWSVKGKRMPNYRISNKKIIISPRKSVGRIFAWVIGLTGLTALTIRQFAYGIRDFGVPTIKDATFKGGQELMLVSPNMEAGAMSESATNIGLNSLSSGFWSSLGPWDWFLIGAWFAVFLFFVFNLYNSRRRSL